MVDAFAVIETTDGPCVLSLSSIERIVPSPENEDGVASLIYGPDGGVTMYSTQTTREIATTLMAYDYKNCVPV